MYWDKDTYALPYVGSPIRTSAGLGICAPHRSFSQLITSFFGSQCQGILLMLLLTWPLTPVYALYTGFFFTIVSQWISGFSQQIVLWNRRYTHFCAYLDSLSICLTLGVIQFSRYMTISNYLLYRLAKSETDLWWAWVDSNYRPHAYQACALTCWATGPKTHSADR